MEQFKVPSLPINAAAKPETTPITKDKPVENITKAAAKPEVQCPYKIPQWSKQPAEEISYSFEVLKSGQIIDNVENLQSKAYWTFGRLPENDIEMAHPTISRFHAILQYRPKQNVKNATAEEGEEESEGCDVGNSPPEGWYVYDMDSTHGTFLNKQRIPPKVYIRIRVGHILKLGASTRAYILQGPVEDEEPESELSITELKAKRQQELEAAVAEKKRLQDEAEERKRNEGCGWGMTEDADEETDLTHNPYASTNNEELFLDDPKKTLRGYFEREGLSLEYKCDEMSVGSFVCRVELPLDDSNGRPIIAEVVHKGKKKDCVLQCALEACRILDRHGVLRQSNQEPMKRMRKKDSDSEDDDFLDRTGDIAKKRERKTNAKHSVTLTYEDLVKQENNIKVELEQLEISIKAYQERQKLLKSQDDKEDLDDFMSSLQAKEPKIDKTEIRKLRLEEQHLKSEQQRIQRLIQIAKPFEFSIGKNFTEVSPLEKPKNEIMKKQLPMIGKRNQFSKFKTIPAMTAKPLSTPKTVKPIKLLGSDEEEIEEDDNKANIKSDKLIDKISPSIWESKDSESKNMKDTELTIDMKDFEITKESHSETTPTKDIPEDVEQLKKSSECVEESKGTNNDKDLESTSPTSASTKKRRHRTHRQRGGGGKRQDVDVDDEDYEASEKYAKWLPPENQTGDGFTKLNEKFGY